MGVRILGQEPRGPFAMYDSVTGTAFGPVFDDRQAVEDFCEWLKENPPGWAVGAHVEGDGTDPRHYPAGELERTVEFWRSIQEYVGEDR